ncbi:lectin-like [Salvia miltiorrhiza]|uniref:lectin-like n=1 Tax=Salvia miltiorrhiza TaxID=226208 RepID=UPI0025AC995C|nr:lectin-like [Salvia miltiorrhiza]
MASPPTKFDFDFYESKPKELIYQVDAHFPKETPFLRLTKTDDHDTPLQRSTGRVLYSKPVAFGHGGAKADFETTVKFIVRVKAKTPHADGLVFFIVPEGHAFPSAAMGGNLGIFEPSGKSSHVFAVAFDIYPTTPGYITLGICIESRIPKSVIQVPDSFVGKELTLGVSYVAATGLISASVSDGSETFPVSFVYNLSEILPPRVQVGLASSTGEYVVVHDVASWGFKSTIS